MNDTLDLRQVIATLPALQLIERLRGKHGAVLFHQSGGCCDGSSPMCYPVGDFIVGDRGVQLGEIGGRGGMFSLENGEGVRFLVRSRLFSDDEFAALQDAGRA